MKLGILSFIAMFIIAYSPLFGEATLIKELSYINLLRENAMKYDLSPYVDDQVVVAEDYYSEAIILLESGGDLNKVSELLTSASNNYYTAIEVGYPMYSEALLEEVNLLRDQTISMKANDVAPDEYDEAEAYYLIGDNYVYNSEYNMAIDSLKNSRKRYDYTLGIFYEKQEKARMALDEIDSLSETIMLNLYLEESK